MVQNPIDGNDVKPNSRHELLYVFERPLHQMLPRMRRIQAQQMRRNLHVVDVRQRELLDQTIGKFSISAAYVQDISYAVRELISQEAQLPN
jgi:hypothetical protein